MNAASARSIAVAIVTSVVLGLSLAGCGGGDSAPTGAAGTTGSKTAAAPPAATGPSGTGQGAGRMAKRAVTRVCRGLSAPLPALPAGSSGAQVRAAAQQTVGRLVPLALALETIAGKQRDPALVALAQSYRALISVYQRLSIPAKPAAVNALVRQAASSRRAVRQAAVAAGVPKCVPR